MSSFQKAAKSRLNLKDSEIVFSVDTSLFPKDVIFKACYAMIDAVYIYLNSDGGRRILVYLKTRKRSGKKQLEHLRNEFLNEILNVSIRKSISKQNQKIVEKVIGGAINAALTKAGKGSNKADGHAQDEEILAIEHEIAMLKKELEQEESPDSYEKDPLGIRKPIA